MQGDLFNVKPERGFVPVEGVSANVCLFRQWMSKAACSTMYEYLTQALNWQQPTLTVAKREVLTPRLQVWMGELHTAYGYSGRTFKPEPWDEAVFNLKTRIEHTCNTTFNSVLVNWYRSESDSVGWHADNEPELGLNPVIASLSLGATRRFLMRPTMVSGARRPSVGVDLNAGDLLLMAGATQRTWQHSIPKSTRKKGGRINLTFRSVH